MGRDRAKRVSSAPRGLGLYRREGREGFFFVKNLAAQAKTYPGRIKPIYLDEWIKSPTGQLITAQKAAEAYCHRRNAEIQEMLLSLKGETISYSGSDLEGIASTLAEKWIRGKQRGLNLQALNVDRMEQLAKAAVMSNLHGKTTWAEAFAWWNSWGEDEEGDQSGPAKYPPISGTEISEEADKLQKLCWQEGFRPSRDDLLEILTRFSMLISEHSITAKSEQAKGLLVPPSAKAGGKGFSWQSLMEAKGSEGMAAGSMKEISRALERLKGWMSNKHQLSLPTGLDVELAIAYRSFLFGEENGLKHSTASKEIRYLSSVWASAERQQLIEANPWTSLPKNRRMRMKVRLDARKTPDDNKILSPEKVAEIHRRMNADSKGRKDPSFDVFFIQAVTGTRIQEVAGLRKCDFTKRSINGKHYHCIEIRPWSGRGFSVMGDRGGIKTAQSERVIPLPDAALSIWKKHTDPANTDPAFPQEEPKNDKQHWGDRLSRRMRDKIPEFQGTHSWRETMINNLVNAGYSNRIVEMLTGKTGHTPLNQYTSDDLASMQKAINEHASYLNLPPHQAGEL